MSSSRGGSEKRERRKRGARRPSDSRNEPPPAKRPRYNPQERTTVQQQGTGPPAGYNQGSYQQTQYQYTANAQQQYQYSQQAQYGYNGYTQQSQQYQGYGYQHSGTEYAGYSHQQQVVDNGTYDYAAKAGTHGESQKQSRQPVQNGYQRGAATHTQRSPSGGTQPAEYSPAEYMRSRDKHSSKAKRSHKSSSRDKLKRRSGGAKAPERLPTPGSPEAPNYHHSASGAGTKDQHLRSPQTKRGSRRPVADRKRHKTTANREAQRAAVDLTQDTPVSRTDRKRSGDLRTNDSRQRNSPVAMGGSTYDDHYARAVRQAVEGATGSYSEQPTASSATPAASLAGRAPSYGYSPSHSQQYSPAHTPAGWQPRPGGEYGTQRRKSHPNPPNHAPSVGRPPPPSGAPTVVAPPAEDPITKRHREVTEKLDDLERSLQPRPGGWSVPANYKAQWAKANRHYMESLRLANDASAECTRSSQKHWKIRSKLGIEIDICNMTESWIDAQTKALRRANATLFSDQRDMG